MSRLKPLVLLASLIINACGEASFSSDAVQSPRRESAKSMSFAPPIRGKAQVFFQASTDHPTKRKGLESDTFQDSTSATGDSCPHPPICYDGEWRSKGLCHDNENCREVTACGNTYSCRPQTQCTDTPRCDDEEVLQDGLCQDDENNCREITACGETFSCRDRTASNGCGSHELFNASLGKCQTQERDYPSILQAWNRVENLPHLNEAEEIAKHDLIFSGLGRFRLRWKLDSQTPFVGNSSTLVDLNGSEGLEAARDFIEEIKRHNPLIKILVQVRQREAVFKYEIDEINPYNNGFFHPDSASWLKDSNGNPYMGWGDDTNNNGTLEPSEIRTSLIDFSSPDVITTITKKAQALADSGLFDGIMFDWLKAGPTTWIRDINGQYTGQSALTGAEETSARQETLKAIRKVTPPHFLILGNGNYQKHEAFKEYINGSFMECYKDRNADYSQERLRQIEEALHYNESHLRAPRINGLELWRKSPASELPIPGLYRGSSENRRIMRLGLTLSLTHSNGYYLFADPNQLPSPDHLHDWYPEYDVALGKPAEDIKRAMDGRAVRQFTNGYVVCNGSEIAFEVSFDYPMLDPSTGEVATTHWVPATDGKILIKRDTEMATR